jgi:hypothetical protein
MITLVRSKTTIPSVKPLDYAGFVLDVKGHKVVALKLSSKVATEIAGDVSVLSESLLSKLKGKISGDSGTERWLAVTSIANPMLEDYETFGSLIAQGLTTAIGIPVGKTDLAIVGSIRI